MDAVFFAVDKGQQVFYFAFRFASLIKQSEKTVNAMNICYLGYDYLENNKPIINCTIHTLIYKCHVWCVKLWFDDVVVYYVAFYDRFATNYMINGSTSQDIFDDA